MIARRMNMPELAPALFRSSRRGVNEAHYDVRPYYLSLKDVMQMTVNAWTVYFCTARTLHVSVQLVLCMFPCMEARLHRPISTTLLAQPLRQTDPHRFVQICTTAELHRAVYIQSNLSDLCRRELVQNHAFLSSMIKHPVVTPVDEGSGGRKETRVGQICSQRLRGAASQPLAGLLLSSRGG